MAAAFSIGDKGYIGAGYDGVKKTDFWEYDPSINLGVSSIESDATSFSVSPNPSGVNRTTIQFRLRQSSHIYIKVYDVKGKEIKTLLDVDVEQGKHSVLLLISFQKEFTL